MKKLLPIVCATLSVCAIQPFANAQYYSHGERACYGSSYRPSTVRYVSGYDRWGQPITTEKSFIGYSRCGEPMFRYRKIYMSAPSHKHSSHSDRRNYEYNESPCQESRSRGGWNVNIRF